MQLEKLNLHKSGDRREFETLKEKLDSFTSYKKRLKRDIRKLRSGRQDFYFFHRFEFGSKRESCFLFGDVEDMPWTTMIEGGTLAFPEMEEEDYKGWEKEYKTASGYCKRLKTDKNEHTIFMKVTDGRSTLRSYFMELQELFDEVFGEGRLRLDIINLDEDNELLEGGQEEDIMERLDTEIREWERSDESDLMEQFEQARDVFKLIEEWRDENPRGKSRKPKEYERIVALEEQFSTLAERIELHQRLVEAEARFHSLAARPLQARLAAGLELAALLKTYQKAFNL